MQIKEKWTKDETEIFLTGTIRADNEMEQWTDEMALINKRLKLSMAGWIKSNEN